MEHPTTEHEFSFKGLFVPFTTLKAIHWIIFIGITVYANMLFNNFVWDDLVFIINNSQVHIIDFATLFGSSLFNSSGYYRPLSATYFALVHSLFTNTSFYYHILQLTFHITNTILVFLLFKKFFSRNISFFLALIFLIHPMQVESVSFIAATDSELFFLFGVIALFISTRKHMLSTNLFTVFSLLMISILTKETGILFLFVILLYRFLFLKAYFKSFVVLSLITITTYIFIRFFVGGIFVSHISAVPIGSLPIWERLINLPLIFIYYIGTFLFPNKLAIDQQWITRAVDLSTFYLPLFMTILFITIILALGVYVWKKNNDNVSVFLFFCGWFLIGILLLLQIFPLDMTVADRWFYFPIVGLLGLIGVGIQSLHITERNTRKSLYAIAIAIIILLSIRTVVRNANWVDPFTLYTHDTSVSTNFDMEGNLASEYLKKGDYKNALKHEQKSVVLFPYEDNLLNLAMIYQKIGNMQKANDCYSLALTKQHYSASKQKHLLETYQNYVWFLLREGKYVNALDIINQGLQEYPSDPQLWEELAIYYYKSQNLPKATSAVIKAKELAPNLEEYSSLLIQIQTKQPINLSAFPSQIQN